MYIVCTNCGNTPTESCDTLASFYCCGNKAYHTGFGWDFSTLAFKMCATRSEAARVACHHAEHRDKLTRQREEPAQLISFMWQPSRGREYEAREINRVCELRLLDMFRVAPPAVGSVLTLEDEKVITKIKYKRDRLVLYITNGSTL